MSPRKKPAVSFFDSRQDPQEIIDHMEKLLSRDKELIQDFNTFIPPNFQIIVSWFKVPRKTSGPSQNSS